MPVEQWICYIANKCYSGPSVFLLYLEIFRWALKQEKFENLGQWKHSVVTNPEWNKLAYSWPILEDESWNDEFDWPMEGYLIAYAPPLKKNKEKSSGENLLGTDNEETVAPVRSKLTNSCLFINLVLFLSLKQLNHLQEQHEKLCFQFQTLKRQLQFKYSTLYFI